MNNEEILNHTKWECRYHVVWIPKCRKKALYGQLRKQLGPVLKGLAQQKESEVVEGHLVADHIHMLISIPSKYAVAQIIGFIKGKSAIWITRMCGHKRNFTGQNFGREGITYSTTGMNEEIVREHIKKQEERDKKIEQFSMFEEEPLS